MEGDWWVVISADDVADANKNIAEASLKKADYGSDPDDHFEGRAAFRTRRASLTHGHNHSNGIRSTQIVPERHSAKESREREERETQNESLVVTEQDPDTSIGAYSAYDTAAVSEQEKLRRDMLEKFVTDIRYKKELQKQNTTKIWRLINRKMQHSYQFLKSGGSDSLAFVHGNEGYKNSELSDSYELMNNQLRTVRQAARLLEKYLNSDEIAIPDAIMVWTLISSTIKKKIFDYLEKLEDRRHRRVLQLAKRWNKHKAFHATISHLRHQVVQDEIANAEASYAAGKQNLLKGGFAPAVGTGRKTLLDYNIFQKDLDLILLPDDHEAMLK